jgi:LysR family nitrogen assimilation transcriptional regulator
VEIPQLTAFVHVCELGSFTRAASVLGTPQPALSRLVRQLEIEFGQTLLERNGRGVSMTAAGQLMLAHAKGILQQIERASHDVAVPDEEAEGHFTIGLPPGIARITTVAWVKLFKRHFPRATISIVEGLSVDLAQWLMRGRIDAAMLYDISTTSLLEKRLLLEEEFCLIRKTVGPTVEPAMIRIIDLAKYPLILPGRKHAVRSILEAHASEMGFTLTIALEIDTVESILDLVDEGYGFALLPVNAVTNNKRHPSLEAVRFLDPGIRSKLVLATSKQHRLSVLAKQAIAACEGEIMALYLHDRRRCDVTSTSPMGMQV